MCDFPLAQQAAGKAHYCNPTLLKANFRLCFERGESGVVLTVHLKL